MHIYFKIIYMYFCTNVMHIIKIHKLEIQKELHKDKINTILKFYFIFNGKKNTFFLHPSGLSGVPPGAQEPQFEDHCSTDKTCEVWDPLSYVQAEGCFCSDLHRIWSISVFQRTGTCSTHLICFMYVDGCKQKLFTAEQDAKSSRKTDT